MRNTPNDPEVVRERIEETRARMSETIEEIGERLNPDRIEHELKERARAQMYEAKDAVSSKVRTMMHDAEIQVNRASNTLVDTIKENPIPAAMVGVGLAWMLANRATSDRHVVGYDRDYVGYVGQPRYVASTAYGEPVVAMEVDVEVEGTSAARGARSTTDQARYAAENAADTAQRKASEVKHQTQRKASEMKHEAERTASDLKHRAEDKVNDLRYTADQMTRQAQYQARRVEHRVEDVVTENPLAAGAVALALGFAAGMMVPETRQEHRMMGPMRDQLIDQAQNKVQEAGQKVKDMAENTASTVKTAVEAAAGTTTKDKGSTAASPTMGSPTTGQQRQMGA